MYVYMHIYICNSLSSNSSQGEFSAERNAERHFEQLYLVLQKKELQAKDGLVRRCRTLIA
jgi:hypothetical protein